MNTPELDKLSKVKEESQKIGEFLEWLTSSRKVLLCRYTEDVEDEFGNKIPDGYHPLIHGSHGLIEELLAQYFKIDLKKADAEKEAIYQQVAKEARAKK